MATDAKSQTKITYATMSGDRMADLHRELDGAIEQVKSAFGKRYPLMARSFPSIELRWRGILLRLSWFKVTLQYLRGNLPTICAFVGSRFYRTNLQSTGENSHRRSKLRGVSSIRSLVI